MSESWMIASGKGGVGKSTVAAALALALSKRQLQTICVDTDIGLRSLDMLLGMQNKVVYDVLDVARKDCKLRYALIQYTQQPALSLLPASQLAGVGELTPDALEQITGKLKKRCAYVLLDAPAGIARGLRNLIPASDHCLLVTTPDDVAIRDAERLIALLEAQRKPRPMLVVNRVVPKLVREGDQYAPQTVANTLDVPLLGFLPEDMTVLRALSRHESFYAERCPAQEAMERICSRFLGEYVPMPDLEKRRRFFHRGM